MCPWTSFSRVERRGKKLREKAIQQKESLRTSFIFSSDIGITISLHSILTLEQASFKRKVHKIPGLTLISPSRGLRPFISQSKFDKPDQQKKKKIVGELLAGLGSKKSVEGLKASKKVYSQQKRPTKTFTKSNRPG